MFTNINPLILLLVIFWIIYFFQNSSNLLSSPQPPYHDNIEELTLNNRNYRQVLFTTKSNQKNFQLVLMSLLPGQEIGMENHPRTTQFIRVEKGHGLAIINGKRFTMKNGDVVVVPPNSDHNLINVSNTDRLQLYAIYTPAEHPLQTVQLHKPKDHHPPK